MGRNIPISQLKEYAQALSGNSQLLELSLVGTRSSDSVASEIAESLKSNKTLQKLNLETDYLSAKGVKSILEALNESENMSLKELRVDNQKQPFGPGGEQE